MTKDKLQALLAKSKQAASEAAAREAANPDPLLRANQIATSECESPEGKAAPQNANAETDGADNADSVRKFVTGETAKPPVFNLAKKRAKPEDKPVQSAQQLLARMAGKSAAAAANAKPEAGKRDILWGTGVTKKSVQSADSAFLKTAKQTTALSDAEKRMLAESEAAEAAPPIVQLRTDQPKSIVLDEYQQAALDGIASAKVACLIGSAGTGKTTTEQELLETLEPTVPIIDLNLARPESQRATFPVNAPAIACCAFTGRAVQQMKRALDKKWHGACATIHATLGYMPTTEAREDPETGEWKEVMVFRPTFTKYNKLPFKIVVLDEAGMAGIPIWNELIEALPDDCRIIMIGDINQLPPVQGRSVLGFAMLKWPTFALEKIHRQAEGNPIIANAHRILQGRFPQPDKRHFAMVDLGDIGSITTYNKTIGIVMSLHAKGLFDPMQDGFIVPQNIGTIGQEHFNEKLVHNFNPPRRDENGAILNHRQVIIGAQKACAFAVGDKVMLLKNDRPRNLTNGMTGVVVQISINGAYRGKDLAALSMNNEFDGGGDLDFSDLSDDLAAHDAKQDEEDENKRQASHIVTVRFGDLEVPFSSRGDFANICHAYAFTCHKSQGGEYRNVIILVHSKNIKMLTREWLYTAVTRAQEKVILIYNERGLAQAINTQRIKGNSVKEKAESFLALQDRTDTKVPILPEPKEI